MEIYFTALTALIVPLLIFILGFIASWFWYNRSARAKLKDKKELKDKEVMGRIVELEKQLSTLKATVVPISSIYQAILVKELTHFHTPKMDDLLVKLGPPNILTDDEVDELAIALKERAEDMGSKISASERDAAIILPYVVKRANTEIAALAHGGNVNAAFVVVTMVNDGNNTPKNLECVEVEVE